MPEYNTDVVAGWLDQMQNQLQQIIASSKNTDNPVGMIGIRSGGVDVGRHLHAGLGLEEPLGELNISFYRDDFSTVGLHPVVGPSQVPFSVDGMHIVLVDDVLSTGRTVRAAMNEIFDYGRPARITLAVLVQRSGQELPIKAEVIGRNLDIPESDHVRLDVEHMTVTVEKRRA